jgi:5-methylcytosine-specific restriction endonuclease McrA
MTGFAETYLRETADIVAALNADENLKRQVWNKASKIPDYASSVWRRDVCGSVLRYLDHGNTNSRYGWEIDHDIPTSRGGTDDLTNLQPLYWETNRQKGDTYHWKCESVA